MKDKKFKRLVEKSLIVKNMNSNKTLSIEESARLTCEEDS